MEFGRHVMKQRKLSMERDALVTHIQSLPGFGDWREMSKTPFGLMMMHDDWSVRGCGTERVKGGGGFVLCESARGEEEKKRNMKGFRSEI
jgi:hypothetical protein